MPTPDLLQRQIEYYRARAPEYDEWFYREGRYDHGAAFKKQWEAEVQIVRQQLLNAPKREQILEMAPGTGIWTSELLKIGDHITALDASAEMIAINRAKLQSDRVHYQQTDLFSWQPEQEYDMVFFGFWLSHVPTNKLSQFLTVVHRALKKGGRLFLVDSQKPDFSNPQTQTENLGDERQKRVLKDGRQFEIVKIYYQPPKLSATLRQHGFDIEVQTTPDHFLYADGVKLD